MNKENQETLNPNEIFPGQRPEEQVQVVIRRHPIILLPFVIYIGLMIVFPQLFYMFVAPDMMPFLMQSPYKDVFFLLTTIYYGFVWIGSFIAWSDYYLDIWIVTDQRIIDVEQKGFFHRVVSEVDLKRVQDISSSVTGFIPTFFGFGDIMIQTAAEMNKFTMESIPHPVTVRREITELTRKAQANIPIDND